MFPGRSAIMLTMAAAVLVTLPVLGAGCGSGPDEFDKAANYTPEAVAQELMIRYRALRPDAKTSSRGPGRRMSAAAIAARDKADHKSKTRTTKKRGPTTIDDVLEDIDDKIALVKGTSRAETTKKVIETISSDSSLPDGEKKTLTELVGRLAN
jgi:hypothetical protein